MATEGGGQTVLITSNGDEISKSIAFHLARKGFRVVLMGNEKSLERVAASIREGSVEVVGLEEESLNEEGPITEAVSRAFPGAHLDAFVHCLCYQGKSENHLETSQEEFKKIVKINFTAPWFFLNAVATRMRDQPSGGSIVFLTSIVGADRGLFPGAAAYAACSAALQHLARVSALEIGKYKIRVNAIARGLHLGDEFIRSVGKARAERLVSDAAPLSRWLHPHNDVVSTVLYLVTPDSRFLTGTTVFVDGAQSITRPRLRSYI